MAADDVFLVWTLSAHCLSTGLPRGDDNSLPSSLSLVVRLVSLSISSECVPSRVQHSGRALTRGSEDVVNANLLVLPLVCEWRQCAWCSLGLLHGVLLLPGLSLFLPSSLASWCCVLLAVGAWLADLAQLCSFLAGRCSSNSIRQFLSHYCHFPP